MTFQLLYKGSTRCAPAGLLDVHTFGDTEQLCSHLGAALLLARTALATCAASAAAHAALDELSQLALQVACLFCTPDVDAEASAGPSSPAAMSTPGASTPGLAVCQPEVDRLLAATVALVGQWAVQQRQGAGGEEGGEAALPAVPPHADWLRSAARAVDVSVRLSSVGACCSGLGSSYVAVRT